MPELHPTWPPSTLALPEPSYVAPDPSKKSHARKQPKGHIPRPRNAFILFRCDFVRQNKVPDNVVNDHQNISRIVGKIWRGLTNDQRAPWIDMAEEERLQHLFKHPYSKPGPKPSSVTKRRKRPRNRRPSYADLLTTPQVSDCIEYNPDKESCNDGLNIASNIADIQHNIQPDRMETPRPTNVSEESPRYSSPKCTADKCGLDLYCTPLERDSENGLWSEWCQYPYANNRGPEPETISTASIYPYPLYVPDAACFSELDLKYRLQDGIHSLDTFSDTFSLSRTINSTGPTGDMSFSTSVDHQNLDEFLSGTTSYALTLSETFDKLLEFPVQGAQVEPLVWEVFLKATQLDCYSSDEYGIYDDSTIRLSN